MRKITNILFIVICCVGIYLMGNLLFDFPLPKWYDDMVTQQVEKKMSNDPFLKLGKDYVKVKNERDSLLKRTK